MLVIFMAIILLSFDSYKQLGKSVKITLKSTTVWGFYGHKKINRLAVFTLPKGMISFYKKHIEYITEHAVDPDKRRYAVEGEAPRHYIDIDHYTHDSLTPFQYVPKKWKDAIEKFSEDTLQAYGIVPWHVYFMHYRLTKAFKAKDANAILKISAEIGHYIGDASVPLHTTENYNGQLTGQIGIHALWESFLPEQYSNTYNLYEQSAKKEERLEIRIIDELNRAHQLVPYLLKAHRECQNQLGDSSLGFFSRKEKIEEVTELIKNSITISDSKVEEPKLILGFVE